MENIKQNLIGLPLAAGIGFSFAGVVEESVLLALIGVVLMITGIELMIRFA